MDEPDSDRDGQLPAHGLDAGRYRIVERSDGVVYLPVPDDPLAALRAEFDGVEKSARQLRADARASALEDADR